MSKIYRAVLAGTGSIADAHVRAIEATNGRVQLVVPASRARTRFALRRGSTAQGGTLARCLGACPRWHGDRAKRDRSNWPHAAVENRDRRPDPKDLGSSLSLDRRASLPRPTRFPSRRRLLAGSPLRELSDNAVRPMAQRVDATCNRLTPSVRSAVGHLRVIP